MSRRSRKKANERRRHRRTPLQLTGRQWACLGAGMLMLLGGGAIFADWWSCLPEKTHATYVGSASCIECHQGISHRLPEEYVEAEHERYEREDVPCTDCHDDMEKPPQDEDWDWE